MKFFMFKPIKREFSEYCMVDMVPDGTNLLSFKMAGGEKMGNDYPDDAKIMMSDRRPDCIMKSDFLANTESILPVSNSMKEVIESIATNEIEYLPFSLINHKGRVASPDYFIINVIGAFDCLNLDASVIRWSKKYPDKILDVRKYVLDAGKLKNAPHIFRPKESPREYIISEELANAFKAAELTNINLVELEVV